LAENVYEGMYILDSNRYGRDPEAAPDQIRRMIEDAGGTILVSRLWEERRLAYPIRGQRKGTYWLAYFRLEAGKLSGLERACQLSDGILRVLFLKVDPRIVDALVAHAQAGPGGAQPADEAASAEKEGGEGEDKAPVLAAGPSGTSNPGAEGG
jgi:small subunit ribosomal protein S6